jgi:hypothetical protein
MWMASDVRVEYAPLVDPKGTRSHECERCTHECVRHAVALSAANVTGCTTFSREWFPALNYDAIQIQPRRHRSQLDAESVGDRALVVSRLDVRRRDKQAAAGAVGLQVDTGHKPIAEQEWQYVTAPLAFLRRNENLETVLEAE